MSILRPRKTPEPPPERPHGATLARPNVPGISREVLDDLIADASVKLRYPAPVRLRPVPLPPLTLIERLTFISTAMHADDVVDTDTLNVLDEISAAMAAVDNPHPLRMALAPILAQMTEDQT